MGYRHRTTLAIPAQVSCLSCIEPRQFLVGSDDGSLRLYSLDTLKVLRGVRGLGPISSIAPHPHSPHLWVASGRQAFRISLELDKLVLTRQDVLQTLDIGIGDDDDIGELCFNPKGTSMAFCTDSGSVGVVDVRTSEITRMKQGHKNVCGSVRFIPDRPSELVSGGYDYSLLHFDFVQGRLLSRDDLPAPPSSSVSLSPPFILCLSMSSTGVIAAGTADGRLYIGTSGEKSPEASSRQKRQRRWKGLNMDGRIVAGVADGPIVALIFTKPRELLICTLLGKITQYAICGSAAGGSALELDPQWKDDCRDVFKVNTVAFSEQSLIIGGFQKNGTGVIEVWSTC